MKIVLITGLPGSGKTYLANTLGLPVIDDLQNLNDLPKSGSFVVVDITFMSIGKSVIDAWFDNNYPDHEVEWIYFENDPEKAQRNVDHRNDGRRVEQAIKLYTQLYNPPSNALPIWQAE